MCRSWATNGNGVGAGGGGRGAGDGDGDGGMVFPFPFPRAERPPPRLLEDLVRTGPGTVVIMVP